MAGTTITVFWNVTPCDLVYTHRRTLKMETAGSPESSVLVYRSTLRHIPENKLYCRKVKWKSEVLRPAGILYAVAGNAKTGRARVELSHKLGLILLDGNEPKSSSPQLLVAQIALKWPACFQHSFLAFYVCVCEFVLCTFQLVDINWVIQFAQRFKKFPEALAFLCCLDVHQRNSLLTSYTAASGRICLPRSKLPQD
jgi:hypothetical protein